MAALTSPERILVGAQFQSDSSQTRDPLPGLLKADIQAAIVAIDDWVVANAASFNTALPAAAKTNLTASQKAALLSRVLKRRYETGA